MFTPLRHKIRQFQKFLTGFLAPILRLDEVADLIPKFGFRNQYKKIPTLAIIIFQLAVSLADSLQTALFIQLDRAFNFLFRSLFPVLHPGRNLSRSEPVFTPFILLFEILFFLFREAEFIFPEQRMIFPAMLFIVLYHSIKNLPKFIIAGMFSVNNRFSLLNFFLRFGRLLEKTDKPSEQTFPLIIGSNFSIDLGTVAAHFAHYIQIQNPPFDQLRSPLDPARNFLIREIRKDHCLLFSYLVPERQNGIRWDFPIPDQVMDSDTITRMIQQMLFQQRFVRTVQRELLTSPAERNIKRFRIHFFGGCNHILRGPPLRFVRGRDPAVIKRGIPFRQLNAP